ncbi:carbohydrate ABC transporter permease [Halocella sp. SP3-1]|uniref:carbohydrate ABC transporter permease n=1 Tax=Halocella sp. SP3-1 TaxID=2382161 RepID=UPI000F750961|nr:carbohydrate ABC transporter permease [Halocella sp. SP3-1]AZO93416.1 carbohydrate ABC transporter permease [Halocella sp. SP3-1]
MFKKKGIDISIINILIWISLITAALIILLPLIFMITSSIMPATEILKLPYPWVTNQIYWQNYWNGLKGPNNTFIFLRNILNSLIVASTVTFTTIILSALTGYGLAKFKFKGRNLVFIMFMATMMIPFEVIMIPLYLVIVKMGFIDSYIGLILPFLTTAFGVFLMRQSLITFPDEVLDAARIDGASELSIFLKIVMPNVKPSIATLAILSFRTQWDSLLWPLLVVQSDRMKTIPLYIMKFMAETHTDEGIMMAIAVMASIPMFVLFFTMSRYFISSGLHSATKG